MLNPEQFWLAAGHHAALLPTQQNRNCYGDLLSPYTVYGVSWASDFPDIAEVTQGMVEGILPGMSMILGEWDICYNYYIGYPIMGCQESCSERPFSSDGNILRLVMLEPAIGGLGYSISDYPTMPVLQARARLLGYNGGLGDIHFDWTYRIDWTGDKGVHTEANYGGESLASGNEESVWNVPIGQIIGGDISATVQVVLPEGEPGTYRVENPHIRKLKGTNPTSGAVKAYIDLPYVMPSSTYWFAKRMANHESGYRQFASDGMPLPNSGGDGGYGVFQLTPPRDPYHQVWDWKGNIDGGKVILDEKKTQADVFWSNQKTQFNSWKAEHPDDPDAVPPPDTPDGGCVFSYAPAGSKKDYRDAIWIKRYNGASVDYINWNNVTNPQDPKWSIPGGTYVTAICNTSE